MYKQKMQRHGRLYSCKSRGHCSTCALPWNDTKRLITFSNYAQLWYSKFSLVCCVVSVPCIYSLCCICLLVKRTNMYKTVCYMCTKWQPQMTLKWTANLKIFLGGGGGMPSDPPKCQSSNIYRADLVYWLTMAFLLVCVLIDYGLPTGLKQVYCLHSLA